MVVNSENILAIVHDCSEAFEGMEWILRAAVNVEFQAGRLTKKTARSEKALKAMYARHNHRIEEILPEIDAGIRIIDEAMLYILREGNPNYASLFPVDSHLSLVNVLPYHFSRFAKELLANQEKIRDMDIAIVAGHQGSGKGEVCKVFEEAGYHLLSLSGIVRPVAAAWGLRNTQTTDKIITGELLKENFGPDILVLLGLQHAASNGIRKVVIDGPRGDPEVDTALRYGATLVGVTNHTDYDQDFQIRLERTEDRVLKEPNRASDVEKFKEREAKEAGKIRGILERAQPQHRIINSPTTTLEELKTKTRKIIEGLNANSRAS